MAEGYNVMSPDKLHKRLKEVEKALESLRFDVNKHDKKILQVTVSNSSLAICPMRDSYASFYRHSPQKVTTVDRYGAAAATDGFIPAGLLAFAANAFFVDGCPGAASLLEHIA